MGRNTEIEPMNAMMSKGVDNLISVERSLNAFDIANPDISQRERFDELLRLCVDYHIGIRGFTYLEQRLVCLPTPIIEVGQ